MKSFVFYILMLLIFLHTDFSCKIFKPPEPNPEIDWSEVKDGLRFRIWTDKKVYTPGEEITLNVQFQNAGDQSKVILVSPENQIYYDLQSPLYDIERLLCYPENSSTPVEYFPLEANIFQVIPLFQKIESGQTYLESTVLDSSSLWVEYSDIWTGERKTFALTPGNYVLRAIYHWDELPYDIPERRRELQELGAPLWLGELESNPIAIEIRL